jgi:hypothetical protein
VVADPKWIRFVAGGAASCTAEVCTISIDAVKLRLQLQGQNGATSQPRLGMLQMVKHIVQNEGVGGLFKGLSPALLRQVPIENKKPVDSTTTNLLPLPTVYHFSGILFVYSCWNLRAYPTVLLG